MSIQVGIELEMKKITVNAVQECIEGVGAHFDGFFRYHGNRFTRSAWDAEGWRAEEDSSLGTAATRTTKGGIEVISRPLVGIRGINEMKRLCTALNRAGATVDVQCGTHVTLGLERNSRFMRMSQEKKNACVREVMVIYDHFQPVLDALCPNSRSVIDGNNGYCHGAFFDGKMSAVNISKFVMYGIVEFRQFGVTLNGNKIEQWIRIMNAIIAASFNNNHSSKNLVLADMPKTIAGMVNFLGLREATSAWMINRVESLMSGRSSHTRSYIRRESVLRGSEFLGLNGVLSNTSRWV